MTDQQFPPPHQDPHTNLVPPKPKPTAAAYQPAPAASQYPQAAPQQGNQLNQINSSEVYPTPPPEQGYPPFQQAPQGQQQYQQYQQQAPQGQQQYQQYQQQAPQQYQQQASGQPSYQIPVQPQSGQPGSQNLQYPYMQQAQQWQQGSNQQPLSNNSGMYLAFSVASLVFCGGVLAIPAIVYAVMMNTAYKQSNVALYMRHRNTSRVWLIVALCLGLVANIFLFTLFMAGLMAGAESTYY